MNRLERRVRALEIEINGPRPIVFVYPRAASPEHEFSNDRAYYQDCAEELFQRNDFDLVVFPGDDNRPVANAELVEDVAALFKRIAKNSTRAGVDPVPASTKGGA